MYNMYNIEDLARHGILVFGDLITDIYEFGTIHRLSREAPVPIIEHDSERVIPGGAGNVIANITSLGGKAYPVSVLGEDGPGEAMLNCLTALGVEVGGIVRAPGLTTTTKRRILAQGVHTVRQQMLRLDRISHESLDDRRLAELWESFHRHLPLADAVVVSDYHLPVIPGAFFAQIASAAKAKGKLVIVDSRHRLMSFQEPTLITPNRVETEEAVGKTLDTSEELAEAGRRIMERTGTELLLITLGEDGMALFEPGKEMELIPVLNRLEVFDVSGAGDTVVAAITLGLLSGMPPSEAARFANTAAGLVVRKLGTATVSLDEIIKYRQDNEDKGGCR